MRRLLLAVAAVALVAACSGTSDAERAQRDHERRCSEIRGETLRAACYRVVALDE